MNILEKRKIFVLTRIRTPDSSARGEIISINLLMETPQIDLEMINSLHDFSSVRTFEVTVPFATEQ
jgi:hypothetical protein